MVLTELPEAALNPQEQAALHEPLERIIQRMSPNASRRFQALSDPITVMVCMGLWANRIIPLVQLRNQQRKEANSVHRANQQYTNGANPTAASVTTDGETDHPAETFIFKPASDTDV